MNDTFSFHAPAEVFRRRLDPRWIRRGMVLVLVLAVVGSFARWVVTSERTADRLLRGWRQAGQKTTISIGVAVYRAGQRPEALLDAADAALYAAKSQGRNQVAIEDVIAPI